MRVRRYAEGTSVSVEASRGEISGILAKHGVRRQGWQSDDDTGDELMFEIDGSPYRLSIVRPTMDEIKARAIAEDKDVRYISAAAWQNKLDAEWRRRWRATVLLLKAKMEFIGGGDTTVERELMAYRVLRDGRTLEEAIIAGGLPALTPGPR